MLRARFVALLLVSLAAFAAQAAPLAPLHAHAPELVAPAHVDAAHAAPGALSFSDAIPEGYGFAADTCGGTDAPEACSGIRPGAPLVRDSRAIESAYCTMAFVLTDGQDYYVATAGHCFSQEPGPDVRAAAYGVPGTFGSLVYRWCEGAASNGGCGVGADFALVKVDADKRQYVNPAMCRFGGAVGGVFTEVPDAPRVVEHFGWGPPRLAQVEAPPQARQGLGVDFSHPTSVYLETTAVPGDSGSGVLISPTGEPAQPCGSTPPQALGVLTHAVLDGQHAYVQRLDASLARVEQQTGLSLQLVSAALAPAGGGPTTGAAAA